MAAISYSGIADQLKLILAADALTSTVRCYVEEEPQFGLADNGQVISIFTDNRVPSPDGQSLSAGKRTRYHAFFSLWVAGFSLESYKAAADIRDALIGNVELVLMKDRSVGGKVQDAWLEGGQFVSAKDGGSNTFVAAGEIKLGVEVSAINT